MAEAPPEEVFQPLWIFHPSRPGGVLVETQKVYDELMKQGGWVESPAEFGVFTAPNVEQQVLQAAAVMPAPPPMVPTTGPAVQALEVQVAALTTDMDTLREVLKGYDDRLQALEAVRVERNAEPDDKAPPPPRARQEKQ